MRNIKNIFFSDLHSLIRNLYVLIIALGLCFLPALYAWFNIYSNWDPYGNTDNIQIAVASKDAGYTDADGIKTNAGDKILETLKENTSIDWVFTTAKQAKNGVYRGDYYAAVVLPKDFSSCMYEGFMQGLSHPQVVYYENEKKNAVATKITDTAVTTLQNNINKMYISILVSNVFEKENTALDNMDEHATIAALRNKVTRIEKNLTGYSDTTAALADANTKLSVSIDNANESLDNIRKKLKKPNPSAKNILSDSSLLSHLTQRNRMVSTSLSSAMLHIDKVRATTDSSAKIAHCQKALSALKKARTNLNKILSAFQKLPADSKVQNINKQLLAKLEKQITKIDSIQKQLRLSITELRTTSIDQEDRKDSIVTQAETYCRNTLSSLQGEFDDIITPLSEEAAGLSDTIQTDISNSLQSILEDIALLKQLFTGTKSGLSSANKSLSSLSEMLKQTTEDLEDIDNAINTVSESEWLEQALSFMQGNPEGYGDFFAAPIKTKTTRVYPVDNYGSGVTPFYTTLAIWVGGIFLVSMIKVKPNRKKFPDARPHELFFGRFLLFFLLGQVQTLIIVIGNLVLLHTQCLYPKRFWFASAVASLTFLLLIYAFTVSFGDVGKALIVVFVVIQIAGSSGTYPIEILPEFLLMCDKEVIEV